MPGSIFSANCAPWNNGAASWLKQLSIKQVRIKHETHLQGLGSSQLRRPLRLQCRPTNKGEMPDVDVTANGGQMPEYDVDAPEVKVGTENKTVQVPTVDVESAKDDSQKMIDG
jgi:hypothetical protein